jgi:predicted negative regulator of RcsB-dependent stress response
MFEEELEMEKRESSAIPLLLIVALILMVVGLAGYYFWQSKQVLTSEDATTLVSAALTAQGPAMIHIHVGE